MNLLAQLPPPQRAVLLLHFIEDFSLEEIARITGTQLGTVKSRLHYAKRALRKLVLENEQISKKRGESRRIAGLAAQCQFFAALCDPLRPSRLCVKN